MALKLLDQKLQDQSGISADYWRIIALTEMFAPKSGPHFECKIGLYINKAASDADKQPLQIQVFAWYGEDYTAIREAEDKRAKAYEFMKRPQMRLPQPQGGVTYPPGYLETPVNFNPFVEAEDV